VRKTISFFLPAVFLLTVVTGLAGCGDDGTGAGDTVPVTGDNTAEDPGVDASPSEDSLGAGDIAAEPTPSPTVFAELLDDGTTVADVDLARYLGKWYEIATYEIVFQTGCAGSTATYSLEEDGTVGIKNECYVGSLDGEYKVDTAVGEFAEGQANSKLFVTFPGAPRAAYWIIELDGQEGGQPYEWAVVGSNFPIFLWILSRTPQMPQERWDIIAARLEERRYDLSRLSFTEQPED
jgi:apolipoprotein D and lipocalin family protein